MQRRSFLQTAGLALAGGTQIAAGRAEAGDGGPPPVPRREATRPRVLIAAGDRRLAATMASALGERYAAVLADTADAWQQLPGCAAIVYAAQAPDGATDLELLDRHTRHLYALLTAAAAGSVKAVVYLSSLSLMSAYPESYAVNEDFRPLPGSQPASFAPYLGEFVCREFAREGKLRATVLRLGRVVDAARPPNSPPREPLTEMRDLCQVVAGVLDAGLAPEPRAAGWQVLHVESAVSGPRFDSSRARRYLRYAPKP